MTRNNPWHWLLACLISFSSFATDDTVKNHHAWARAHHAGQEVGAALHAAAKPGRRHADGSLHPVADSVEIHKMAMNNGVMEMRMMETLPLPAGQTVKLEPAGST